MQVAEGRHQYSNRMKGNRLNCILLLSIPLSNSKKRYETEPKNFSERYHTASETKTQEAADVTDEADPE